MSDSSDGSDSKPSTPRKSQDSAADEAPKTQQAADLLGTGASADDKPKQDREPASEPPAAPREAEREESPLEGEPSSLSPMVSHETQETAAAGGSSAPPSSAPPSQSSSPPVLQVLAPRLSEEQEAARRKDKTVGLVIVGVTFVLCILGSLWGKELAEPELSEPPGPPTFEGLVGWPEKVDPVVNLKAARTLTKRSLLRGFSADHVSHDGTIDFEKTGTLVRYSFQSNPGEGPQPPRPPGTVPRRSYCGKQNVYIRRHGLVAEHDVASFPCSPKLKEPLADPACSLKQVWDFMIKNKSVPTKRPARIEYFQAKGGPAYRFTLPGTSHRVTITGDCSRELKGDDAIGSVP